MTPPKCATQLDNVTNSLGAPLGLGPLPVQAAWMTWDSTFAVLAEESEDEAEPELMPHRQRRRAVSPPASYLPNKILSDPLKLNLISAQK